MPKYKISKRKKSSGNGRRSAVYLSVPLLIAFFAFAFFGPYKLGEHLGRLFHKNVYAQSRSVVGYLVYWDKARGIQAITDHGSSFTEISPWAYTIDSTGQVILDPAGGASIVDDATVNLIRSKSLKLTPTIHNDINGTWDPKIVHDIIVNPTAMQNHINNIVNLVVSKGYDGADMDYENLYATDRDAYSNFMASLATALHAQGKTVYVNVYGKTSEPGTWNGPQAQNYAALGAIVDEVRIFLYDYNPSKIGPIAPYSWVDQTLAFASTQIPQYKIMHGLATYGYDWNHNGRNGVGVQWQEAVNTAAANNATIQWDATDYAPWYTYGGHTVWFENSRSLSYKLDLSNKYNVGGIYLWRLGGEDPGVYTEIQNKFPLVIPNPPPPPTVLTFNPTDDATVSQGSPTSNYGSTTSLIADPSPFQQFLLKFNVQGVGTKQIVSAKLRIYSYKSSSLGGDFRKLTSSLWDEGTVTWANQPAAESTIINSLGSVGSSTWYDVDVTKAVTGDGVVGFMDSSSGSKQTQAAGYYSKEYSTTYKPQLIITAQ